MKIVGWLLVMGYLSPIDGMVHSVPVGQQRFEHKAECEIASMHPAIISSYQTLFEKYGEFRIWCEVIVSKNTDKE